MELKGTYYRNAKGGDGQETQERRKAAGYAGFQESIVCPSRLAAITKALIRLWRSSVVHLCVYVCARGVKEGGRDYKSDGVAFADL